MTYAEKLQHPKWQKKRLEILNRDGFKCQLCKDDQNTLHIHHNSYSGEPWEVDDSELKTVCKFCHSVIEALKKEGIEVLLIEKQEAKTGQQLLVAIYQSKNYAEPCAAIYAIEDGGIREMFKISLSKINRLKTLMEL